MIERHQTIFSFLVGSFLFLLLLIIVAFWRLDASIENRSQGPLADFKDVVHSLPSLALADSNRWAQRRRRSRRHRLRTNSRSSNVRVTNSEFIHQPDVLVGRILKEKAVRDIVDLQEKDIETYLNSLTPTSATDLADRDDKRVRERRKDALHPSEDGELRPRISQKLFEGIEELAIPELRPTFEVLDSSIIVSDETVADSMTRWIGSLGQDVPNNLADLCKAKTGQEYLECLLHELSRELPELERAINEAIDGAKKWQQDSSQSKNSVNLERVLPWKDPASQRYRRLNNICQQLDEISKLHQSNMLKLLSEIQDETWTEKDVVAVWLGLFFAISKKEYRPALVALDQVEDTTEFQPFFAIALKADLGDESAKRLALEQIKQRLDDFRSNARSVVLAKNTQQNQRLRTITELKIAFLIDRIITAQKIVDLCNGS